MGLLVLLVVVLLLLLLSDMVFEFSTVTFRLILDILQDWKISQTMLSEMSIQLYTTHTVRLIRNLKSLYNELIN